MAELETHTHAIILNSLKVMLKRTLPHTVIGSLLDENTNCIHQLMVGEFLLLFSFQTKGRDGLLVMLFLINLVCLSLLPVFCLLYRIYGYGYHGINIGSTELTLLLIAYTLAYSVLTLYTTCLVSKYGCCFIDGKESDLSNRTEDNRPHTLQVSIKSTLGINVTS